MRAGNNHDIHPTARRAITVDTTRRGLLLPGTWLANNRQPADRAGL